MHHPPAPDRDDEESVQHGVATLLDPQRYVREADRALTNGHRDQAIALIAKAYLAFDLLLPRRDSTIQPDLTPAERSSRSSR